MFLLNISFCLEIIITLLILFTNCNSPKIARFCDLRDSETYIREFILFRNFSSDEYYCSSSLRTRNSNSNSNSLTISFTGSPFLYTKNVPITKITPTINQSISSCSVSPSLPRGLTISSTDCSISGIPLDSQVATDYTIIARSSNSSASTLINLQVKIQQAKFMAVTSSGSTSNIAVFSINSSTGALTAVSGSPFSTGVSTPRYAAITPKGDFVYIANDASASISAFSINPNTGFLTQVSGSPFPTAPSGALNPSSLVVDPMGKFLYTAPTAGSTIFQHSINQTTGALSFVSTYPCTTVTNQSTISVDPTGKFLYLGNNSSGQGNILDAYTINSTTGALISISAYTLTGLQNLTSIAIDPLGRFVYAISFNTTVMGVYSIESNTGVISAISGSPFGSLGFSGSSNIHIEPLGKFAYIANGNSTLTGLNLNSTSGSVSAISGSPFNSIGSGIGGIQADPTSTYLYHTNGIATGTVRGYTINQTTGVLTAISGSPFDTSTNTPNYIGIVSY